MTFNVRNTLLASASTVVVAVAALGGCSGGPTGAGTDVGSHVSSPTEVASVSAFDRTVTFYSATLNGQTNIGMREIGSAFNNRALVAPLLAQRLTTLEVYLALAPPGATPPPALVAAQAGEAASMGRGAEIRLVTVDSSQLVQKSLSSCESMIFADQPPPGGGEYVWSIVPNAGTFTSNMSLGGNTCPGSNTWVIMGGCNAGSVGSVTIYAQEFYNNCTDLYTIGEYTMDVDYYAYWYWSNGNYGSYDVLTNNCESCTYNMFIANENYTGSP
jgi:hypothetical protein